MSDKSHILVIDDEKNYLLVLQTLLEDEGYTVTAISDPETALAFLAESEVDVVVTDMKMPKVSGREVLQHVKKSWPYIPVLIMTAFGSIESAVEAMKYGAFDYITKPFSNDELLLFMGTDMFFSFESWRAPEEIAELAKIVAFYRNESDTAAAFAAQAERLREHFGGSFEALALDRVIEVSSTALRAGMASGTSEAMLEPQVYGYILREHLYGTNLDLKRLTVQQLRPIALSYLKAKRCAHVLGTAATAVKLAEKYGADVHRAEVAGLLHDCTKKLSMPEQLALCEKYGIALDALEKKALKLLHAKTGAAIARDVFGVDDEIYNAILWHTTGKPDMTVLEKVIYLADFIEPTRDFPGVDALRRTVWGDLDRGLLMGLEMTVEEMEEMGNPIHVNTLAARDYLKGKTNEGKAGSGQQL